MTNPEPPLQPTPPPTSNQNQPSGYPPPCAYDRINPYSLSGSQQPPYPYENTPRKRKAWLWALTGCLVFVILGIGGCVSCVSCIALKSSQIEVLADLSSQLIGENDSSEDDYIEDYSSSSGESFSGYTLEEIKEASGFAASPETNGSETDELYPSGVYQVGAEYDIDPGLYFLGGNSSIESSFFLFKQDGTTYYLETSFAYFGNYFLELEQGDVLVYYPEDPDQYLQLASTIIFETEPPYTSGVYRVGLDIPAGEYTVITDSDAFANASQTSAAYIMQDLDFDDETYLAARYVIPGGTQTITLEAGTYLELYAAIATPTE